MKKNILFLTLAICGMTAFSGTFATKEYVDKKVKEGVAEAEAYVTVVVTNVASAVITNIVKDIGIMNPTNKTSGQFLKYEYVVDETLMESNLEWTAVRITTNDVEGLDLAMGAAVSNLTEGVVTNSVAVSNWVVRISPPAVMPSNLVNSVNSKTGEVVITGADIAMRANDPRTVADAVDAGDVALLNYWYPDCGIMNREQIAVIPGTNTVWEWDAPKEGEATLKADWAVEKAHGDFVLPYEVVRESDGKRFVVSAFEGFSKNSGQQKADITAFTAPRTVVSADGYAFRNCTSLTFVSLPNCMKVGEYVFQGCTNLTSVSLPQCTSVGAYAFQHCDSLSSISLPNCTSVGAFAFDYCTNLTSVSLPQCTSVGRSAFSVCQSLSSISLPNCTSVGYNAFYDCTNLTTIALYADNPLTKDDFTIQGAPTNVVITRIYDHDPADNAAITYGITNDVPGVVTNSAGVAQWITNIVPPVELPSNLVFSVNGQSPDTNGAVTVKATQIGMGGTDSNTVYSSIETLSGRIDSIEGRGRYLSGWNCITGMPMTEPTTNVYNYKSGDYYIVAVVTNGEGATNYMPSGTNYTAGSTSTVVETNKVFINDTYLYDGTIWTLIHTEIPTVLPFTEDYAGTIRGCTNDGYVVSAKEQGFEGTGKVSGWENVVKTNILTGIRYDLSDPNHIAKAVSDILEKLGAETFLDIVTNSVNSSSVNQ